MEKIPVFRLSIHTMNHTVKYNLAILYGQYAMRTFLYGPYITYSYLEVPEYVLNSLLSKSSRSTAKPISTAKYLQLISDGENHLTNY